METLMLTDEETDLVERIGVLHDRLGMSPAPGRVLGLLLVCARAELTFEEIRGALGLSKSSTSAALNLLLSVGSVEYSTRPGERRRYFKKSYRSWEQSLLQRMDVFFSLKDLLNEAHELQTRSPEGRPGGELPRMIGFLEFLQGAIHDAYRSWCVCREATESGGDVAKRLNVARTRHEDVDDSGQREG